VEVKTKEAMSDSDRRQMLQASLNTNIAIAGENGPYIRDVYENECVYEIGNKLFRISYHIDAKLRVIWGEAERVNQKTVYIPVQETIEAKIDELTVLASQREDAPEVQQALDSLLDLLEKEELSEEIARPLLDKADEAIASLSEAKVMKSEEGGQYPRSAFAFAPEADKPADWKLRMWEDATKKTTEAQLGRITAALSPGGFRGKKIHIEKEALSDVKRKIRSAYKGLGVEDADIPKWVKEIETRENLDNYIPLSEATIEKGEARITVIRPGFNTSQTRYYPAEMLARDFKVFEGVKMYADHPSVSEEKDRPERSIRDWIGTLINVAVAENGDIVGTAKIVEPWMQEKLALLRDKGMLDQLGVSINAIGTATEAKIDGVKTKVVERFLRARSVDFVTEAGAGGGVELYEAIRDTDIDLIDVDELRSRRPDIVSLIETEAQGIIQKEAKEKMELEQENKDLKEQVGTLTTENATLKEEKLQREKDELKTVAQAAIKEAVEKTALPDASKTRLIETHKDDESAEGIAEAIKSEATYIAAVLGKGEIVGLGETSTEKDPKAKEKLAEAFEELTGSKETAEVAARGR